MRDKLTGDSAQAIPSGLRPVKLRAVDAAAARLRRLVGGGLCAEIPMDGVDLLLEVNNLRWADPGSRCDELLMQTPAGPLFFAPARDLVRLLTAIDLTAADEADPLRMLKLQMATQAVPAAWMSLFGASTFLHGGKDSTGSAEISVSIRQPGSRIALAASMRGSSEAMIRALSQPEWRRLRATTAVLPADWAVDIPVCVGTSKLTHGECRDLRTGDVIVVARPCFQFVGASAPAGQLRIGRRVATCSVEFGNQMRLRFTEWHHTTSEPTKMQPPALESLHTDPIEDDVAIDDLAVTLSFELGSLNVTLAELRALVPGTVLPVAGALPPQVWIRAGGQRIGAGELVELDGQLGVEVRRIGAFA